MDLATIELVLETAPDAMLVVDDEGRIVASNAQTERIFGWTRQELAGHRIEMLVPERYRGRHASHRATYHAVPRPRPMGAGLDLHALRKDGSEFLCEISLAPTPITGGLHFTVAVRDIEERKRVETKFRRFLDAAPDAIVIVDGEGAIALVNSQTERLFGYARAELLGQPVEMLMAERFRGRHALYRQGYFREPVVRSMGSGRELYGLKRDGQEFPIEISLSPIQTESGVLVASAIRDITERLRVDAVLRHAHSELASQTVQIEAANRELEAFSYSVAHDLRAPLRAMMGFAQILLADHNATLTDDGRECLDEIHGAAKKMGALIDALLKLSQVTRTPLEPERVDLGAMARSVVRELAAAEPGRRVELIIAEGLEPLLDSRLARVVMDNLVGNAWKFTSNTADARIEVGSEMVDGTLAYFVGDNGAGFDMAYRTKLFVPFQRLHPAREFPGTGIGLATVMRIITRHGGRIWADGAVGRGARFWFTVWDRGGGEA